MIGLALIHWNENFRCACNHASRRQGKKNNEAFHTDETQTYVEYALDVREKLIRMETELILVNIQQHECLG